MKKTVWILNHYATDMFFSRGERHYWMAKYLRRRGYEPVVFGCNAKHNSNGEEYFPLETLWREELAQEIQTPFVFVQGRTYTGNGKQRILNMVDFYRNVKKTAVEYARKNGKPDVIYASSVHPLTLVAGIQLAKKFGVKCICEVRDLWPESIVEYSDKLTKNNPIIRLLYAGERWIYKKANALIFTFEGGYDYILERGWEKDIPREKVFYINNGVDLEQFDYNREHFRIEDEDLENPDLFKVVYTGSIRRVNNLGMLLDAAKNIRDPRVKILIWGDGDERKALEQRLKSEDIGNVVFKGRVDKRCIPNVVSRADLNIAHNDPSALFRFGISFNKLFEYLAAEKPVLCDFSSRYNPAVQSGAGMECESAAPEEIALAVEASAQMETKAYREYCERAKAAAKTYDFSYLTEKLIEILEAPAVREKE